MMSTVMMMMIMIDDDGVCVYSCVIAELFTEGTSPFDLSQLLAYRSGEYNPSKLFQSIDDSNIRVRFCVGWNSIKILAVCVYSVNQFILWYLRYKAPGPTFLKLPKIFS